ncbi:MAG: hypothetical protein U0223_11650 [Nitrospira sp.]|nr:hypothetical protein [Nitrospira sp.]
MNDYIEQLETDLAEARKAATPVTVEVVKHTRDEKVSVSSNGTTRTDWLGGEPVKYLPGHVPVVSATPTGLAPVTKEVGKVIKENEEERVVKLVSGTIRRESK